jgi:hypothetical protein
MGGKLSVTGQTSLGALNVSGAAILSSTLNVTGAAGFSTVTASSLTLNGSSGNVLTFPNGSISSTGNLTTTGTVQSGNVTSSGNIQAVAVGIGAAPSWPLDIQVNQNASTKAHILNNSSGTNVAALWEADNGTCQTDVGVFGTGATPSGSIFYTANRGYVIGGCPNGLLIQAAGTAAMLYLSAPNGNNVIVPGDQHFLTSNNSVSHPTAGTCGTSPAVSTYATDNAGYIAVGSGTVTSCQVIFAAAFPQIPACECNSTTIGTWCAANPSTSGLTMTFGTSVGGTNASWHCWGNT